jgi:hypothetical protein
MHWTASVSLTLIYVSSSRLGLTALYNKAAHQVTYEGWHLTHSLQWARTVNGAVMYTLYVKGNHFTSVSTIFLLYLERFPDDVVFVFHLINICVEYPREEPIWLKLSISICISEGDGNLVLQYYMRLNSCILASRRLRSFSHPLTP